MTIDRMFAIEPAAGIFSLFGAGFSEREFALTSGTRIFSVVRFRRELASGNDQCG
ncbi:hypothetical protein ACLEE4_14275 [Lonsdalea quercina]|uniref:hypothetical protein n=1 Tax=Lonsdalea quercina TaxID=71657 RepID=UPI00397639A1